MISPTHDPMPDEKDDATEDTFWRRLLYRWFVEYNPLYLVSACLVLGGMILLSRGLARTGSVHGELGVAAIAEVYAFALIGGAALLMRIGHRRPAVMLALLTVLYQCDLTLHTATCAHLGAVGMWAAAAWLGLFAGKLHALAWAMKIRLSRRAIATATLGGVGLAVLPLVVSSVGPRAAGAVVALWLSGLVLLHRPGAVTSRVELDTWGLTVLRRAVRASWLLSALLFALHVLLWSANYSLELAPVIVVCLLPLLATRLGRSETQVWSAVGVTLLVVALKLPGSFATAALVAAVTLGARAIAAARSPDTSSGSSGARPRRVPAMPYRVLAGADEPPAAPPAVDPDVVVPGGRAAMLRLATGAVFALYLSAWTSSWTGGPWPAHLIPLDVIFAIMVVIGVWKLRVRAALAPLAATGVHLVVQLRLVPAPRTTLEWGGAAIGLGFVLLIASLAASYWLRPSRGVRSWCDPP